MAKNLPIGAPTSSARNTGIDTLRGLCILLVVLHHIALRIPLKQTALADYLPQRLLGALNFNGYEAVFVFFVISGFLIASNTLARRGTLANIDIQDFYVRRAARILPCLLLLVLVLGGLHWVGAESYVIKGKEQSLTGTVLSALGLYLNWYEGQTGWLPGGWDVLWSLSIEEVFYLAFPMLCLLVRDLRALIGLLILLALSLPITRAALADNAIWQEKAYLPGMAAIATGVLAAICARHFKPKLILVNALVVIGSIGMLSVFIFGDLLWALLRDGMMLVLTFSAALLVVGLHWRHASVKATPWRALGWLRSCGRLSYEIYLTHMFVVFAVVGWFKTHGAYMRAGHWWYLPSVLLCWLLGAAVARYFSEPCERAMRRSLTNSGTAEPSSIGASTSP